jgi:hypothetical protein
MPRPSPGCLLKARAGGHRAVGNEWERLASAGARNSPPVTGGSMYLVWTSAVPGVDPRRTRGCHFRRSWPCPADARRWSANRLHLHAQHGSGRPGRLRLARGRGSGFGPGTPRRRTWSAESMSAAGAVCTREGALPGERAVARAAARQAPGRRGNLPRTGSPATGRPVPGQSAQPACVAAGGKAADQVPGLGPGTVSRTGRPFSRVRQPAAIPRRQLICLLIRLPADSGAPFQRGTR